MTTFPGGKRDGAVRAASRILMAALRDFRANCRRAVATVLIYKTLSFIVLTPLIVIVARLFLNQSGSSGLTDADIAEFLFTTGAGAFTLILVCALDVTVLALEQACLLTIGLGTARGSWVRTRDAFAHAFARSFAIFLWAALLVARLLVLALPFAIAIGAAYFLLLRAHDINYYMNARPPEFWTAVVIAGVMLTSFAVMLVRRITAWILALPIVVFEHVLPIRAFSESTKRMSGRRNGAALALVAWGMISILFSSFVGSALRAGGRAAAPAFSETMPAMLLFIGSFGVVLLAVMFASATVTAALFAHVTIRLYVDAGLSEAAALPPAFNDELKIEGRCVCLSWPAIAGLLVTLFVGSTLVMGLALRTAWTDRPVLVFAHRGSPLEAPENTLASFRRAVEQHADFVELDVQESSDGVVLVNHDLDLMKLARSPLQIWRTPALALHAVDIGRSFSPAFADERVPTLADALATCKGQSKVDIELKDYGHGQQLEERVVAIVETAAMQEQIVTMSLSPKMVEKMKSLRPQWTSGLLAAKAIGEPSGLPGDFLAVQKGTATQRFIRQAHSAGKPVYVWTIDDPAHMIQFIGFGADGIITDRPALALDVVRRYHEMTEVERLFLFVMTRLGAKPEVIDTSDELRP